MKEEGFASTKHHDEIDEDSKHGIEDWLVLFQKIMGAKKGTKNYQDLVNQLPKQWVNQYHYLLQWGAQYILMRHTAKRGREVSVLLSTHCVFYEFSEKKFFYQIKTD